jgi:hypothetical protein
LFGFSTEVHAEGLDIAGDLSVPSISNRNSSVELARIVHSGRRQREYQMPYIVIIASGVTIGGHLVFAWGQRYANTD